MLKRNITSLGVIKDSNSPKRGKGITSSISEGFSAVGCSIASSETDHICTCCHPMLLISDELIFRAANLRLTLAPVKELESEAYGAYDLSVDNRTVKFRVAKSTPIKDGHFVTLWKRVDGITVPFDISDNIHLFVVAVKDGNRFGHFVFSSAIFKQKGILSVGRSGGKRAMRVYPPWVVPYSKQAAKTQAWQCQFFVSAPLTSKKNVTASSADSIDAEESTENLNVEMVRLLYSA